MAQKKQQEKRRVRATRLGYYNHVRRREGDVFLLDPPTERDQLVYLPVKRGDPRLQEMQTVVCDPFSTQWMEDVDDSTPKRVTATTAALRKQHEELRREASPQVTATGDADVLGLDS